MLTLDSIHCCAKVLPHLLELAVNKTLNMGKKMSRFYNFPVHSLNETTDTILHHILWDNKTAAK